MERKIITVNEFREIGKSNEYFLWHFLQKDQENNNFTFFSIFKNREEHPNHLNDVLGSLKISYYESYTEDSIDFLITSGVNRKFWEPPTNGSTPNPKQLFKPAILLYKGYNLKSSTFETCYCAEGLIEMIGKENPELLSGF